ncbi:MAG TPA: hypothetical protein VEA18_01135 [Candidatus Kapabacteria bacterium]|nr:hypothetical protein [Candidatus Kapabacteria bacterium]
MNKETRIDTADAGRGLFFPAFDPSLLTSRAPEIAAARLLLLMAGSRVARRRSSPFEELIIADLSDHHEE